MQTSQQVTVNPAKHEQVIPKDKIDRLVDMLVVKRDLGGHLLIKKYNRTWLLEILNGEILQVIEKKFMAHDKKGLDIVDFVKVLLGTLEHSQEETIYIVLELVEFFKGICESQNLKDLIRFKDFTNYIVEEFIDSNEERYTLQPRRMPEPSNFMNQVRKEQSSVCYVDGKYNPRPTVENYGIREIDIDPPEIHGRNFVGMKRIVIDKIITDSTHHRNGDIKK